jgi:DHA2 family multidrug resistance protein
LLGPSASIDRVTPDDLDKAQPHPQVRQPRWQGWLVCALKDLFFSIVHVLTTKGHFLGKELFNERNFLLSTIMFLARGFVLLPTLALTSPVLEDLLNNPVDTFGYMTIPRGISLVGTLVIMSLIPA